MVNVQMIMRGAAIAAGSIAFNGTAFAAQSTQSVAGKPIAEQQAETQYKSSYTRREAALESVNDQLILHYADEYAFAINPIVNVLKRADGIDAIALPGGKSGQVEALLNKRPFAIFTGDEPIDGTLVGILPDLYNTVLTATHARDAQMKELYGEKPSPQPSRIETDKPALTGKLVTLRVGKGFKLADADGIADALEFVHGCPATVEQGGAIRDGFFPKNVTVYVDGKKIIRTNDVGSAMAQAVTECKVDAE